MSLFDQKPSTYETFTIRPLELSDYSKNYLTLLEKLTGVGNISLEKFTDTFNNMKKGKMHYIYVAANQSNDKILGTGTLGVEQKFIRNCALKGRVEDLISDETDFAKRSDIDQKIMEHILNKAKEIGCYKMSLESTEQHLGFYENLGFAVDKELEMCNRHVRVGDDTEKRYKMEMEKNENV